MTVQTLSARDLLSRGLLSLGVAFFCGCSSSTAPDSDPAAGSETAAEGTTAPTSDANPTALGGMGSGDQGAQGTQGPDQQARLLIDKSLEAARSAIAAGNYDEARLNASYAIAIARSGDPSADEALRLYDEANRLAGNGASTNDNDIFFRVQERRDRIQARNLAEQAQADVDLGNFDDGIAKLRQAQRILQNNPLISGSEDQATIERLLDQAVDRRARAIEAATAQGIVATQQQLEEEERRLRLEREAQVDQLLLAANQKFQIGQYDAAVETLEAARRISPNDQRVQEFYRTAHEADISQQIDLTRQRWKNSWIEHFADLEQSLIGQDRVIEYDREDYARRVAGRTPLGFSSEDLAEDPATLAIMEKLQQPANHRFTSVASLEDWVAYYAETTGVTFIIDSSVEDLDEEETTLRDFNLGRTSVERALNVIQEETGVKWTIQDGVIRLVSSDTPVGVLAYRTYEVSDIVFGVPDKPGPELKLETGDSEEEFDFGGDEPAPTIVDPDALVELIQANVSPTFWEEDERAAISAQSGALLVRAPKQIHDEIFTLLQDLRRSVGIQVDVEARFLTVSDSFLEDVGVDFRGLGDQSAEGAAGQGLANNPSFEFDDFGTTETINPASPGRIGTGTEPGIFFDDGQDGLISSRTENLYDRTLGGGPGELDNAGGLAVQYAFLDDTEIEVILRAVQKEERSEEIIAPRLLVYNNTRAHVQELRHTSYIEDFEVEIAQAAAVANPSVGVVRDGVVLDVRPVVSADRRFITMELRPTILSLALPIPTFTTTLGAGLPVSIQQPSVTLQSVRTTVTLPDGGTVLLGGTKVAERQNEVSGIPVLMDIPVIGALFRRTGTFVVNRKILILIRAQIILSEEFEPVLGIDPIEDLNLTAR